MFICPDSGVSVGGEYFQVPYNSASADQVHGQRQECVAEGCSNFCVAVWNVLLCFGKTDRKPDETASQRVFKTYVICVRSVVEAYNLGGLVCVCGLVPEPAIFQGRARRQVWNGIVFYVYELWWHWREH